MAFLGARAVPTIRARGIHRTSRNLCARASASPRGEDLRGLSLLRFDLQRLSRLLRGDASVLIDTRADFPVYNPVAISEYYDRRPLSAALRFARVAAPFSLWFFNVRYLDRWLSRKDETVDARADQLRAFLCWAGPTYLKVGQAIGNRPDIVGVAYSNALQKLVDDVGTFDTDVAFNIVREELGVDDIQEAFSEFEEDAVASASLGQVHKARLRSGDVVAVKVQRPSVQRTAALDIYILRRAAAFAKKRFKLRTDLVGIIDEFGGRLWEELDYVREADNCDKFRELYAADTEDIYVPQIYRNFTTKRVLTMEWIEGTKAPWFPKEDALRLIRIGVQCSLRQLLEKGFVHSDPHIGNLLRLEHTGKLKLVYLDFGMVTFIDLETRYNLIAAIARLINRDYANLAKDFVKLGFLPSDADTSPIAPLLEKAFGDASSGGNVTNLSFGKLANNLSGLAFATPIRIPVFFTLVIRSLTILEGIALQTDADFKIVDQSYPYVVSRILTDDSPVLQNALRNVLIDPKTKRIRWSRLKSILQASNERSEVDSDVNGLVPGYGGRQKLGLNSTLSNVSDEALERVLDFALSDRGSFFRDALELELTDTVDAMQLALGHRLSELCGGILPPPVDPVDKDRVQAGIRVAEVVRRRAPQFFQIKNERNGTDTLERRQRLSAQLHHSSRAVIADIAQRNTRRALRKVVRILLGDRE